MQDDAKITCQVMLSAIVSGLALKVRSCTSCFLAPFLVKKIPHRKKNSKVTPLSAKGLEKSNSCSLGVWQVFKYGVIAVHKWSLRYYYLFIPNTFHPAALDHSDTLIKNVEFHIINSIRNTEKLTVIAFLWDKDF